MSGIIINLIEAGKLAIKLFSGSIVGFGCFDLGIKSTKVKVFSLYRDFSQPLTPILLPAYAFVYAGHCLTAIIGLLQFIHMVLRFSTYSQIFAAVIERIAVDMVNEFAWLKVSTKYPLDNHTVHANHGMGVLGFAIGVPLQLKQILVTFVNYCLESLSIFSGKLYFSGHRVPQIKHPPALVAHCCHAKRQRQGVQFNNSTWAFIEQLFSLRDTDIIAQTFEGSN